MKTGVRVLTLAVCLIAAVAWAQTGPTPPETPTGTLDTDGIVTMAWGPGSETSIDHFLVHRRTVVGKAYVPQFTDYGVQFGKDYEYAVTVVLEDGRKSVLSPWSDTVQVRPGDLPPCLSVVENPDGSVTLSVVEAE